MFKGQRIPIVNEVAPNTVLARDGYHLSYNASSADYGSDTTAIVLRDTVFLTLNGDHKDALAAVSEEGGLQQVFDYYLENLSLANHMSDDRLIVKGDNTFNSAINAREFLGDENVERLIKARAALDAEPAADPEDTSSDPQP
jgi:hypothetical protein